MIFRIRDDGKVLLVIDETDTLPHNLIIDRTGYKYSWYHSWNKRRDRWDLISREGLTEASKEQILHFFLKTKPHHSIKDTYKPHFKAIIEELLK